MKLTLNREDLELKNVDMTISLVRFEHFRPEVRYAILAVKAVGGLVTIYEDDNSNYNAILVPK